MFSQLASAGTKALGGARFSLVNVLPGTLLAVIILVAVRSGAYGSGNASLQQIIPRSDDLSSGGAVILLFTLFMAGVLIQPFQVALVQYLEGYWDGLLHRMLGAVAVELHHRRFFTAVAQHRSTKPQPTTTSMQHVMEFARVYTAWSRSRQKSEAVQSQYPEDPDRFMPTVLGNVLRDAEDVAGSRYGLEAMTVYPRMYPTLSKPISDAMTRQLDLIALTSSLCVSFALGAMATVPVVHRIDGWSLVPLTAVMLSVLSYRGAIRAAESHGTLFATAFDLHRFDMLRALHYQLPTTVRAERRLNRRLTSFLQGKGHPGTKFSAYGYDHSIYDRPSPQPAVPPGGEETTLRADEEPATASSSSRSPSPPNQEG